MPTPREVLRTQLLTNREQLLRFIRSKIADPELAEDVLQESLLRALRASPGLQDEQKLVSWFYRIVRNAVTDVYRRRAAAGRRLERYARELDEAMTPEDERALCGCFQSLIPTLKPEYADLISRMDLGSEAPEEVADSLGISRNNLKVRHHRARQQLRERLEQTCRTCARHGCIDCTCGASHAPATGALPSHQDDH